MAFGDVLKKRIKELKNTIYSRAKSNGDKRFFKVLQKIAIQDIIELYPESVFSGDCISTYKQIIEDNSDYIPDEAKELDSNGQPKYWVCLRNIFCSNTGPKNPEAISNNPIIHTEIGVRRGQRFIYTARQQYFTFYDDDSPFSSEIIDSDIDSEIENDIAVQNAEAISDLDLDRANTRKPKYRGTGDRNGKRAITMPKIAKKVIVDANYTCELCEIIKKRDHITFETNSRVNYLEAHHLIPIKYQTQYELNIDRVENIIPLCPTCHRAIHYGSNEVKKDYLQSLYKSRREMLSSAGINIPENFEDFFDRFYS